MESTSPMRWETGTDGSLRCHSDLLDLDFLYGTNSVVFDVLDPATGMTIDVEVMERTARFAAEAQAETERARAETERTARLVAETRAESEQARAEAAEARSRELEAELERRRQS